MRDSDSIIVMAALNDEMGILQFAVDGIFKVVNRLAFTCLSLKDMSASSVCYTETGSLSCSSNEYFPLTNLVHALIL